MTSSSGPSTMSKKILIWNLQMWGVCLHFAMKYNFPEATTVVKATVLFGNLGEERGFTAGWAVWMHHLLQEDPDGLHEISPWKLRDVNSKRRMKLNHRAVIQCVVAISCRLSWEQSWYTEVIGYVCSWWASLFGVTTQQLSPQTSYVPGQKNKYQN